MTSFLTNLKKFDNSPGFCDLVWIANPNDDEPDWQTNRLSFADSSLTLANDETISFNNYSLCLDTGISLQESAGKDALLFLQTNTDTISFTDSTTKTSVVFDGPVSVPLNDSIDRLDGCLQGKLKIHATQFPKLGIELRLFAKSDTGSTVYNLGYPIINTTDQKSSINLAVNLDPTQPLSAQRSFLSFWQSGITLNSKLQSYFCSPLGHGFDLIPQQDARLVFCSSPAELPSKPSDPYYLTPSGRFQLAPASSANEIRLLCGLSGTEYIAWPASNNSVSLGFVPGSDAFLENCTVSDSGALTWGDSTDAILGNQAQTSWVYVAGEGVSYYSRPDGSSLFHRTAPTTGAGNNNSQFLKPLPVATAALPSQVTSDGKQQCFPMVSYGDVDPALLAYYPDLERHVLSPCRQQTLYSLGHPYQPPIKSSPPQGGHGIHSNIRFAEDPYALTSGSPMTSPHKPPPSPPTVKKPDVHSATPQGFSATFGADHQSWKTLNLAMDGNANYWQLANIDGLLKSSLQDTKQFLVISSPQALKQHMSQSLISIAGWQFNLDSSLWTRHGTIIIFKFYANKSVGELINNIQLWTHGRQYNTNLKGTQQSLNSIISEAGDKLHPGSPPTEGDKNYAYFIDTVIDDPDWNGILVLNAYVPLSGLPPQIEGLAAGLNPNNFYAHHFGVNLSPVHSSSVGNIQMKPSALFGLIDYQASYHPATGTNYDFGVEKLEILFANSAIKSFRSRVAITLNQLFSENCSLAQPVESPNFNTIYLAGHYSDENGHPSYSFLSEQHYEFSLTSPVLNTVTINRASLSTDLPGTGTIGTSEVHSIFAFAGSFSFHQLAGMDLFSYQRIPFEDLQLQLSFNPNNIPVVKDFTFNAHSMRLLSQTSESRDGSLVQQFPLKLKGLFSNSSGKTLAALGYVSVDLPGEYFSSIESTSYGLSFDLSIGSLGALGGKHNSKAKLLLLWQANAPEYTSPHAVPTALGINLPFASGKTLFNIENVIKCGIRLFALELKGDAYILKFQDIALKVLGQSIPPSGETDVLLFGDPQGKASSLAWYGAYANTGSAGSSQG